MGKKNKAAKRLARYRAEAQQEVLNREIISKQTAEALYKLCLPSCGLIPCSSRPGCHRMNSG